MAHFVGGLGHAGPDHLVGILRAACAGALQLGGRRRQDEDADDIGRRLLAQLLGALPVDVEQHVPARRQRRFDRRARRAVAIVEHVGPFQQFAGVDHRRRNRAGRRSGSRGRRFRPAAAAASSPTPTARCRDPLRAASRDSVVLPAPDGDDSTNINPRRAIAPSSCRPAAAILLLQVLHLLAELLDHVLHLEADIGQFDIVGLGAQVLASRLSSCARKSSRRPTAPPLPISLRACATCEASRSSSSRMSALVAIMIAS